MRPLRELPLQLTRVLPALMLACACSDAKPRPVVVEDAGSPPSDGGEAIVVDAGDGGACALPGSFGSSSCNACVATTCCDLLAACYADADCKARTDCLFPCADVPDAGGCARACEAAHPDDKDLWYDLWGCIHFNPPCEVHCSVTR